MPVEVRWVREKEASRITGVSVPKLRKDRREGRGPKWTKYGRAVVYRLGDLYSFMDSLPGLGNAFEEVAG